jgi:hypothetical protein
LATGHNSFSVVAEFNSSVPCKIAATASPRDGYPELLGLSCSPRPYCTKHFMLFHSSVSLHFNFQCNSSVRYTHSLHGDSVSYAYRPYKGPKFSRRRLYRPCLLKYCGDNGLCFNSPAVFLCSVTVTASITPVSHISDLRLHQISPTFPSS